ncbi:phosphopantetheine-binding protein [Idiomarina abyssalis]|uniref:phosphopantetheine-binding protein n=1 Tax=Idiomarina abyssalis TaxID=86102 RepID=UPI001C96EAC6|nr:phosphopantetheine-binding protein [Idiomarina abyssalis]QZN91403.1 acyl carrier protein [Idiomarina abyssalis]
MERKEFEKIIAEQFGEIYRSQRDGEQPPELKEDTVLLETGIDSLGFAILVTRLEEELDCDPFSESEEAYYPQTFGEFVDFYTKFCRA